MAQGTSEVDRQGGSTAGSALRGSHDQSLRTRRARRSSAGTNTDLTTIEATLASNVNSFIKLSR